VHLGLCEEAKKGAPGLSHVACAPDQLVDVHILEKCAVVLVRAPARGDAVVSAEQQQNSDRLAFFLPYKRRLRCGHSLT
jgi:hypothetical protein